MNTRIGSKEKQAKFSVSTGKTHELLRNYMTSEYENPMVISFLYIKQNILRVPFRSNHQRCSMKKGVLRNFTKFTGKHLCQSLFFNKVAGLGLQLY